MRRRGEVGALLKLNTQRKLTAYNLSLVRGVIIIDKVPNRTMSEQQQATRHQPRPLKRDILHFLHYFWTYQLL
jgi:hypothetical protein